MSFSITDDQVWALRCMQEVVHASCRKAGWYKCLETGLPIERNFGELIALAHSELSEALEGWRKGLMDDHIPSRKMAEVELADAVLRILDICGAEGFDLGETIQEKFAYNQTRADHKAANRKKEGGKKI